jgi:hypothetical protein
MAYPHLDVSPGRYGEWEDLESQLERWNADRDTKLLVVERDPDEELLLEIVKDLRPGQVLHVLIGVDDDEDPEPVATKHAVAAVHAIAEVVDDFASERARGFALGVVYHPQDEEDEADEEERPVVAVVKIR